MTQLFLKNIPNEFHLNLEIEELKISYTPITAPLEYSGQIKKNGELEYFENGILKIESDSHERDFEVGRTITLLLSLGFGRDIFFDRFYQDSSETLREMVKPFNSGNQIISKIHIPDLIQQCLIPGMKLSDEEFDIFRISIYYLNSSNHGYIEDRLLRVAQSWELTSDFFYPDIEIPKDLETLKNDLLKTYRKWKDHSPNEDKNGQIGSKISAIFTQEKLLSKLELLVSSHSLNIEFLDLELSQLKSLRDQSAHTGRIKTTGEVAYNILKPAVIALQLIWLKRLKYNGQINYHENGWRKFFELKHFFNND